MTFWILSRRVKKVPVTNSWTAAVLASLTAALLSPSAAAAAPRRAQEHLAAAASEPSAQDWPTFHGGPSVDGVSPDTTISDANAGQLGVRWMTPTMAPMLSSPVISYDATLGQTLAYIGNNTGYVEAINVASGSLVWSHNLGQPVYSTPSVYGGSVWVGTFLDGGLYKLNASTGAVQCDVTMGTGTDFASPTIATPPGGKPTVYFGVQDNGVISGPIRAVDEATCASDWSAVPYPRESGSWDPDSFGVDAQRRAIGLRGQRQQ